MPVRYWPKTPDPGSAAPDDEHLCREREDTTFRRPFHGVPVPHVSHTRVSTVR